MGREREQAGAGALAPLVAIVSAALVFVLPSLLLTTPDAAGPVAALAVLLVGLAALAQHEMRSVVQAPRIAEPHQVELPPMLPGRVTDPVHHPLRPRAPGRA